MTGKSSKILAGATPTPQSPKGRKRLAKKPATPSKSGVPVGKLGKVIGLLKRPKGATIADIMKATDWQAHSVRGAISGAIKKKRNLTVVSEKSGAVRIYRIVG